VEVLEKGKEMSVKPVVGNHVQVVNGKYAGNSGHVRRLTMWKVEVELSDGCVVMINQSSVEKCIMPVGNGGASGAASRRKINK